MNTTIKSGELSEFFDSARETAREVDAGHRVTPRNMIWVEPDDLRALLKSERTDLVKFLRQHDRIVFADLKLAMGRSPASLNNDLEILAKYDLIKISREANPGHGMRKVIESTFNGDRIQMIAEF